MTAEEARAEEEEARRLIAEINRLQAQIERAYIENQNLQVELDTLIQNINILADNTSAMDVEVNKSMEYVKNRVAEADVSTTVLFALIDDLTNSYFIFKNLSTASKNVTQFNDEYYTRFKFFNELRRITLGYVIGLDAHICSDETMRKKVEEVYLQNTEYWLAYAIMAVMLWASDEEEVAKRAMSKALTMDYFSCSLFFLLINLRFTRVDAAKKWYLSYLDRVDMENLGNEWQYLLQTYLSGVFGVDQEFNALVLKYLTNLLEADNEIEIDMFQRIENILYDLINAYDKEEFKVIKNRRYNEMVIKAKGDLGQAQQYYNIEFPNESRTKPLDDLLYDWAFEEDMSQVDITVKKFALSYLKKWIAKGFVAYAEDYRKKEKENYKIAIDGWEKDCNEDSGQEAQEELEKHYNKNRVFDTIKDKYVMIFIGMAVASLLTLVITAFRFNKISLVIGILLGVVSGFLLWRRISDMQAILQAKKEHGCMLLKKALEELKAWREMYKAADAKNEALVNVFDSIEI